jgi:homoserine O-acetyltransferase
VSQLTRYRSGPEWESRFGRVRANPETAPSFCADYLIETYLDHQSERFCLNYDANSLLYLSKAMDMFQIGDVSDFNKQVLGADTNTERIREPDDRKHDRPEKNARENGREDKRQLAAAQNAAMPTLILGAQSDVLFPIWQQKEMSDLLKAGGNKNVTYYELDAMFGHDTFLIDLNNVGGAIKGHLEIL